MIRSLNFFLILLILSGCVGASSRGVFGTGVTVALDPRSLGTQIDDGIMDKNLDARLIMMNKSYFLNIKTQVLDGRIFVTGKVDNPEEKLKITKLAWETEGVRSVNFVQMTQDFAADMTEGLPGLPADLRILYDYNSSDEVSGDIHGGGYGYQYDFKQFYDGGAGYVAKGVVLPSVEPAVFELKNPKQNIRGVVI